MFNRTNTKNARRNAKRLDSYLRNARQGGWTPTNATPEQRERLGAVAGVVAAREPGSLTARLARATR